MKRQKEGTRNKLHGGSRKAIRGENSSDRERGSMSDLKAKELTVKWLS